MSAARALLLSLFFASPVFAGEIAGTVAFSGRIAAQASKVNDPGCGVATVDTSPVRLSPDKKAVAEVLVRISKNAPRAAAPSAPVVLEQKGCAYVPRVLGAVKGQKLLLRNSDGTMHNVHALIGDRTLFAVGQPAGARDLEKDPRIAGLLEVRCDLHPWMKASVVVSDHPFFAVSNEEGAFTIGGVPSGHYSVEAWHPRLGTLSTQITVEDGTAADPKFSFHRK